MQLTLPNFLLLLAASPLAIAAALPQPFGLEARGKCSNDKLYAILKKEKPASSYCSTYLGTVTQTVTSTSTKGTLATTTTTLTLVIDPPVVTSVVTFSDCTATPTPNAKRANGYPPYIPPTLTSPPVISSACSCLITSKPTTTRTVTVTKTTATGTTTLTTIVTLGANQPPFTLTQTTTSCTATLPPSPSATCGVTGCSTGAGYISARFDQDKTVASCIAACKATPGCVTVQYGTNRGQTVCSLYSKGVSEVIDAGNPSPDCQKFKFYDVGCKTY